ncbi:MAG: hypothetical protein NTX79_02635 [Candidatus Micrarchaeota archaeon]|nr:hypothetical protein [Candidatus Micrarchaeota archaeon]
MATKYFSNLAEKTSTNSALFGQRCARTFFRMKKKFSSDATTMNEKLARSHLKSVYSCPNGLGKLKHINLAMESQPAKSCSPELAAEIVRLSSIYMDHLVAGEMKIYIPLVQDIVETYGKSIEYADTEKRDAMGSAIVKLCHELALKDYSNMLGKPSPKDFISVQLIGLACQFAPEAEKQALVDEFIAAFLNVMKIDSKFTASFGGKEPELWYADIRWPNLFDGDLVKPSVEMLRNVCIPSDKLERLRYEVAQIFAARAIAPGNGKYYEMLEHTQDALSWLPYHGTDARSSLDILAHTYLEAGRAAKDKQVMAAAMLLRIANSFNCSDSLKTEIRAELVPLEQTLKALKNNTHNVFDGGPTLMGELAGSLASNETKGFNSFRNLANLLLKYMADPTYLYHIQYPDARA